MFLRVIRLVLIVFGEVIDLSNFYCINMLIFEVLFVYGWSYLKLLLVVCIVYYDVEIIRKWNGFL